MPGRLFPHFPSPALKVCSISIEDFCLQLRSVKRLLKNKSGKPAKKREIHTKGHEKGSFALFRETFVPFRGLPLDWRSNESSVAGGNRSDFFFTPQITDAYFLTTWAIAVNEGEQWSFYSPASRHLPFGMLRWQEESQQALILDPDQLLFAETPLAEAERSLQKRSAQLQLDREGSLQGGCRIEYSGHQAASRREQLDDETPQEREQAVQEMVQEWFNNAEVSQIQIENLEDPSKPLTYSWQVRVPGYAQGTGKRLFLQPAFFQTGTEPRFTASQRRHRIYFNYRWSEEDHVTIDLPQGMILEGAGSPPSFSSQKLVHYSAQVTAGEDGRQLIYQRRFAFSGLLFPVSSYSGLKQIFDDVHQRDTHTIILKKQAEGGR